MKVMRLVLLLVAMVVLAPAITWAVAGDPGTGILSTDHDFASGGGSYTSSTAIGLCTICHTPHKAIQTLLLWNHTLSSNTFSWDVTNTTGGTPFPSIAPTYTGPSLKCLSCHDGTVAIGDVALFDETSHPGGTGLITNTIPAGDVHQIANATGSMKGNHPVAMPYPYNNAKNTYNTIQTGSAVDLSEWQATPETSNMAKIRLFTDLSGAVTAGPVAGKTGIECSSCHDPHNKQAVDVQFLRGMRTGSAQSDGYLCLQCHIK